MELHLNLITICMQIYANLSGKIYRILTFLIFQGECSKNAKMRILDRNLQRYFQNLTKMVKFQKVKMSTFLATKFGLILRFKFN